MCNIVFTGREESLHKGINTYEGLGRVTHLCSAVLGGNPQNSEQHMAKDRVPQSPHLPLLNYSSKPLGNIVSFQKRVVLHKGLLESVNFTGNPKTANFTLLVDYSSKDERVNFCFFNIPLQCLPLVKKGGISLLDYSSKGQKQTTNNKNKQKNIIYLLLFLLDYSTIQIIVNYSSKDLMNFYSGGGVVYAG